MRPAPALPRRDTRTGDDGWRRLVPVLSPLGRLKVVHSDDAPPLDADLARSLVEAFEAGAGHGLLQLGAREVATVLPPAFAFWRDFATPYVTAICTSPGGDDAGTDAGANRAGDDAAPETRATRRASAIRPAVLPPDLAAVAASAPPMAGAEYLTPGILADLWEALGAAFAAELADSALTVGDFLKRCHHAWNLVGRVHFNLAENRKDAERPFAFLATYSTRLSAQAKAQHAPLGQALREYAAAADRDRLLSLLLPVSRAAADCPWLAELVDSGEIYHPLRWTPSEAIRLIRDVPDLERAGVIVRMPATWTAGRPPRPQVKATIGGTNPGGFGQDALLDFHMDVTLDGEALTEAEVAELLAQSEGMALLRGRWVEVDRASLERMLDRFGALAKQAEAAGGLGFGEGMRLLAGTAGDGPSWSEVVAGPWLAKTLAGLRSPEGLARIDPGAALCGTLRPYQEVGVRWLHLLAGLGLGACLADDMGLGKTIQVLALMLVRKADRPSLLVAPASLLANWAAEADRFAPSLRVRIAHPSAGRGDGDFADCDLVVTSYGQLLRSKALSGTEWDLAILDEAQAIKNPDAKQTRAAKSLRARARIVLTGTPVENRVSDLWSLFDFLNPGLLGTAGAFGTLLKRLAERPHNQFGPLRDLVRPYILRRLKSDKAVIADLPDKTEVNAYCQLSRKQAALYQEAVDALAARIDRTEGMARRGAVLAFLMRFKQICNHPSQWLGDGAWREDDSGKWARLREIAETLAARQEKLLVFTQFRELTAPLAAFLGAVFGRPGLTLDGSTPIKARQERVRQFQDDEDAPFFVLSLKAGGSGLNLTAASHVVHFDRWWNPAVENQATDRAYRIGQRRNVMVHKFVCRGTLEEKIDDLIESKKRLSEELLEGGADLLLTELDDARLLSLVALDLTTALEEA